MFKNIETDRVSGRRCARWPGSAPNPRMRRKVAGACEFQDRKRTASSFKPKPSAVRATLLGTLDGLQIPRKDWAPEVTTPGAQHVQRDVSPDQPRIEAMSASGVLMGAML
jgi:hypothetical protein